MGSAINDNRPTTEEMSLKAYPRALLSMAFFACFVIDASAQSLGGVSLSKPASSLDALPAPMAREGNGAIKTNKYQFANGDTLSVTYSSRANQILFIEQDWSGNGRIISNVGPFKYGMTTLQDIRQLNGSNGLGWKSTVMSRRGDDLVCMNAYEVKGRPGSIVVFVTQLDNAKSFMGQKDFTGKATLRAIIVANEDYLDSLWGTEKIYDSSATAINWPQ